MARFAHVFAGVAALAMVAAAAAAPEENKDQGYGLPPVLLPPENYVAGDRKPPEPLPRTIEIRPPEAEPPAVRPAEPARDLSQMSEDELLDEAVRARQAYERTLLALRDRYLRTAAADRLAWVTQTLDAMNATPRRPPLGAPEPPRLEERPVAVAPAAPDVPPAAPPAPAAPDVPPVAPPAPAAPDVPPTLPAQAALTPDQLYEEGMHYVQAAAPLNLKYAYLKTAIGRFGAIIQKYPESDKADDAAFQIGENYASPYYQDWSRAAEYYEYAYEWNPRTPYPALLKAAWLRESRLGQADRAVELYRIVVARSADQGEVEKAASRLRALTGG